MNRLMRFVERLLLVVGMAALGWYATVQMYAAREQAALSKELEIGGAAVARSGTTKVVPYKDGTTEVVPYPAPNARAKLGVAADVGAALARIESRRVGLSTVAREGIDTRTLRVAAGHVPGTALPGQAGNAAFAAHRDTFFRPLKDIREGDDIRVTTTAGAFRYVVTSIDIVEPEAVEVLAATSEPTLTLVTCYPFNYIGTAPQRFIVRARLSQPEAPVGIPNP